MAENTHKAKYRENAIPDQTETSPTLHYTYTTQRK